MTTFERVGFIGLGGMGRGLVKNLVAKGVAVTAYDLNPAAISVARSFGATAAGSLHAEYGKQSDSHHLWEKRFLLQCTCTNDRSV